MLNSNQKYVCPVCRYPDINEPAYDGFGCFSYNICPCCETEFGYDDSTVAHSNLREKWVSEGVQWWSKHQPKPNSWDPVRQLKIIKCWFVGAKELAPNLGKTAAKGSVVMRRIGSQFCSWSSGWSGWCQNAAGGSRFNFYCARWCLVWKCECQEIWFDSPEVVLTWFLSWSKRRCCEESGHQFML